MVSASQQAVRADIAKKKATDTAERNTKAVIAAERKGIAADVSAVSGLLEAVPSAARRLRDLRTGTTTPRPAPRLTTILDPQSCAKSGCTCSLQSASSPLARRSCALHTSRSFVGSREGHRSDASR